MLSEFELVDSGDPMPKKRVLSWVVVSIFLMLSPAAHTQETLPVRLLIAAGKFDEARSQLENRGASDLEKAFYEGLILHRQGKYKEAVALFRQILNARPEQVPVRQALVSSLIALEDFEAADYQLDQLIEIDPNENNLTQYHTVKRRIYEKRPFGFSTSFTLVPSTNINRGTTNSVFSTGIGDFPIDEEGKQKSGVGASLTFSGYRQFQLESARLRLHGSLTGVFYKESDINQYGAKLWAEYRKPIERGYWQLAPKVTLIYLDNKKAYNTKGLDFTWLKQTSPKNIWTYKIGGYYGDFYDQDYRNGVYLNGSVSLRRKITSSVSVIGKLGLGAGRPDAGHLQYDKYLASVDVIKSWSNGWLGSVGVELEHRPFRENFTAVDYPRRDNAKTLRFSLVNRNFTIWGATPRLSCAVKDVHSNVAFYDYSVQECAIGFTRRF